MRYYPAFRRAIPHQEVDSYILLTRLPLKQYCYWNRSTCMLKARRQRSSWARIKLSKRVKSKRFIVKIISLYLLLKVKNGTTISLKVNFRCVVIRMLMYFVELSPWGDKVCEAQKNPSQWGNPLSRWAKCIHRCKGYCSRNCLVRNRLGRGKIGL